MNTHSRQTGIIDPNNLTQKISMIGAGGIGSWTALALLKMGCQNLEVYDFDKVEIQNTGSQIYNTEDIGILKVDSLYKKLLDLTGISIGFWSDMFTKENTEELLADSDVVIFAVDNIDTRKQVYEALKSLQRPTIIIDGRMSGNAIEIYTCRIGNKEDEEFYDKTFFAEEESLPVPCTERAVVYNCFVIAGFITDLVAKIANEEELPRELMIDLKNLTLFT